MATFVLIPGATLGSWCWKKVTPLLRNAGHEVYPITLTGLAERAHLMSPAINLDTHFQDIVGVLECEELTNVILVGHSHTGIAASGAADRVPERIGHLVYLDAFVPQHGRSEIEDSADTFRAWVYERVVDTERGKLFMPPDVKDLGIDEPDMMSWVGPKLTPDPFATWTDTFRLGNETAFARIPKTYIKCIGDLPPTGKSDWDRIAHMDFIELQAGHMAMLTAPAELVAILEKIAASVAG